MKCSEPSEALALPLLAAGGHLFSATCKRVAICHA